MRYEIRLGGAIDRDWSSFFDGACTPTATGPATRLTCELPDQAALHAVLARIRDAGLVLISVARVDRHEEQPR